MPPCMLGNIIWKDSQEAVKIIPSGEESCGKGRQVKRIFTVCTPFYLCPL